MFVLKNMIANKTLFPFLIEGFCFDLLGAKTYTECMVQAVKNRMAQYRQEVGITQEALGEKLGVTRQTIIAIEKGNYTPSVLLALKIAKYFKVKIEEIFFYD